MSYEHGFFETPFFISKKKSEFSKRKKLFVINNLIKLTCKSTGVVGVSKQNINVRVELCRILNWALYKNMPCKHASPG